MVFHFIPRACGRWGAKLALALILVGALGQAAADVLDDIKARGTLIVGGKSDYKPFGFRDAGGPVQGFSVDLANRVAEKLGVKVEIISTSAANQLQFLQQGKVDVLIAAMNDTPERRKIVHVIEPGYYASAANVLLLKKAGVKEWGDLKGKSICATQGSYFNRAIEDNGAQLVILKGTTEAYNALKTGSCVGFAYDDNSLRLKLEERGWEEYDMPLKSILPQPIAMAVRLGEDRFAKLLTELTIEWYRTGYIRQLEQKWFPKNDSGFVQEMSAKYRK